MNTFFIFKKLAGTLLMPFQFSLVLIVIGVVFLWLNRHPRLAKYLVTVGAGLLVIFGNPFIGYHLVHNLEARYPPFQVARPGENRISAVRHLPVAGKADAASRVRAPGSTPFIVVLSGGASDDPELPETDRLTSSSALRVTEAVQIYRRLASSSPAAANARQALPKGKPDPVEAPRIILAGGPTVNTVAEAIPMQKLAESLGIPANAILLETGSDDTFSEAKDILPLVGHKPFILATSAFQMPRAVALFRHFGMHPVPAPANYLGQQNTTPLVMKVPPSLDALGQSAVAWHEHLGMFWEHLRGQL